MEITIFRLKIISKALKHYARMRLDLPSGPSVDDILSLREDINARIHQIEEAQEL